MWPLAGLYWVWPHQVTLLWIQDAGVVLAEAAAFTWLCEIAGSRLPAGDAARLSVAGLLLLLLNPWIWWSVSFDFHTESLYVPLLVLLGRDLKNGRSRAWAWVGLLVACGDVADTYLAGLGITMMLIARGRRLQGAALVAAGVAATGLITLVHGNLGSSGAIQSYAVPGRQRKRVPQHACAGQGARESSAKCAPGAMGQAFRHMGHCRSFGRYRYRFCLDTSHRADHPAGGQSRRQSSFRSAVISEPRHLRSRPRRNRLVARPAAPSPSGCRDGRHLPGDNPGCLLDGRVGLAGRGELAQGAVAGRGCASQSQCAYPRHRDRCRLRGSRWEVRRQTGSSGRDAIAVRCAPGA